MVIDTLPVFWRQYLYIMKPYSVLFPVLTLTIWALTIRAERNGDAGLEPDLEAAKETALSGEGGSEDAHRPATQMAPPEPNGGERQMTLQVSRQGAMIQQRSWANSSRAMQVAGHVARHDALLSNGVGETWCTMLSKVVKKLKEQQTKNCLLAVKDVIGNPALAAKGVNFDGEHGGLGHLLKDIPGFQVAAIAKTIWSLAWNGAKLIEEHMCGAKPMGYCKESHAIIKVVLASFSLLVVAGVFGGPGALNALAMGLGSWLMTHGGTDFCAKVENAWNKNGVKGMIEVVTGGLGQAFQAMNEKSAQLVAFLNLHADKKLATVSILMKQLILGLTSCMGQILFEVADKLAQMFEESQVGQMLANVRIGGPLPPDGPDYYLDMVNVNINCAYGKTDLHVCAREVNDPQVKVYPVCVCYNTATGLGSSLKGTQYLCTKSCYDKACMNPANKLHRPNCGCTDKANKKCTRITEKGLEEVK